MTIAAGVATLALAGFTVVAWSSGGGSDTSAEPEVVMSGGELFTMKGCAVCHDGPGSESVTDVGPDLTDLYLVADTREPGVSAQDYVRRSISSPDQYTVPGFAEDGMSSMPALPLTAAEVEALADYLLASG